MFCAFVLHTRPFRNTSLLVYCFSEAHGRITLVARGARRPKSPFRGLFQAFLPLCLDYQAKQGLQTLRHAEMLGMPLRLQGMTALCGLYLNELLMYLLPEQDAHQTLYADYTQCLQRLHEGYDPATALRCFERRLLEALGYGLVLDCEAVSGQPVQPDSYYRYLPEQGLQAVDIRLLSPDACRHQGLFSGEVLQRIANEAYDQPAVLRASKHLMRLAIDALLGGKRLRTRDIPWK